MPGPPSSFTSLAWSGLNDFMRSGTAITQKALYDWVTKSNDSTSCCGPAKAIKENITHTLYRIPKRNPIFMKKNEDSELNLTVWSLWDLTYGPYLPRTESGQGCHCRLLVSCLQSIARSTIASCWQYWFYGLQLLWYQVNGVFSRFGKVSVNWGQMIFNQQKMVAKIWVLSAQ